MAQDLVVREKIPGIQAFSGEISASDDPKALLRKIDDYCRGYRRISDTGDRVLFLISKGANFVRDLQLFKPTHSSFTQWVQEEIIEKHGISEGSIWSAISVCRTLPIDGRQFDGIGITKLIKATQVVKRVGMNRRDIDKLLRDAQDLTRNQFEDKYDDLAQDGRKGGYRVIRIPTTIRISKSWEKFLGERNPDRVLQWIIANVTLPENLA